MSSFRSAVTLALTMRILLTLTLAALALGALRADEIEDSLNAALAAHKSGNLKATQEALAKANQLLNAKSAASLSDALPDTIGIWKAGKVETQSLEGAGGGTSIRRSYRHGDKEKGQERRGTAVITVDSPLLSKVSSFLTNPQIGALLGAKPTQVGAFKAVHMEKQGALQLIVGERYLVAIEGKKLKLEELSEIAAGLRLDLLK